VCNHAGQQAAVILVKEASEKSQRPQKICSKLNAVSVPINPMAAHELSGPAEQAELPCKSIAKPTSQAALALQGHGIHNMMITKM
jgi:hypothetical protein